MLCVEVEEEVPWPLAAIPATKQSMTMQIDRNETIRDMGAQLTSTRECWLGAVLLKRTRVTNRCIGALLFVFDRKER